MRYYTKPPVKWELHYLDNQTKKYQILVGEEDKQYSTRNMKVISKTKRAKKRVITKIKLEDKL